MSPAQYVSVSLATCVGLCRFGEAWAAPLGRKIYLLTYSGRRVVEVSIYMDSMRLRLARSQIRSKSHAMGPYTVAKSCRSMRIFMSNTQQERLSHHLLSWLYRCVCRRAGIALAEHVQLTARSTPDAQILVKIPGQRGRVVKLQ